MSVTEMLEQAVELHRQGRAEQARALYDAVISQQPDNFDALHLSGVLAAQAGRSRAALKLITRALQLQPASAAAHGNLGNVLRSLGRPREAANHYARALVLSPEDPGAVLNWGVAAQDGGDHATALTRFDRAIELAPGLAQAHTNRGLSLKALGRLQEALASYEQALACAPADARAHFNRACAWLQAGDWERGWPEYEWRWQALDVRRPSLPQPQLHTADLSLLDGKTVAVWGEQGLGDTLQFCRWVPALRSLGARVVLQVQPPLVALLSRLDGLDSMAPWGLPVPSADFHCPLPSLPLLFSARPDTLPAAGGYLRSDPGRVHQWQNRLPFRPAIRVGLAWSGNSRHLNDLNRSIALGELLDRLPSGPQYVSLQKEVREADRAALAASQVLHFGQALEDFDDTAALCELVDLTVTVDTSIAHLAGALGRRVCVLLPFNPDWRWLLGRSDSPWYQSATLLRQSVPGEWSQVLLELQAVIQGKAIA